MEEHEPQWYEQARKGPFQEPKFTDSSAEKVIRRVQQGRPGQAKAGYRFRGLLAAAAVVLVLAGAGALYLNSMPAKEGTSAGITRPAEDNPVLTDEALKKNAEQLMQKQLGKKLPFEKMVREGNKDYVQLVYRESEQSDSYAFFQISKETGEVTMYSMCASYGPGEIGSKLIDDARQKLQELGYKREFQATGLTRYAVYGRTANKTVEIQNVVHAEDADINFTNGAYVRAGFDMDQNEVSEELKEAGLQAIRLLRSGGEEALTKVLRFTIEGAGDEITLIYGTAAGSPISVTLDYATNAVLDASDYSLNVIPSTDPEKLAEYDRQLLEMDNAKLQSAAAAIADKLYGIRLEDYMLDKNGPRPGVITFESRGEAPAIEASYNLDGVMYSFSVKRESNTLLY
ncbi:hypothetical protein PAECIP111892_03647 [Paenibacillus auburnensis]|uniref:PepSY domain-containing protein n=1 Tax=Paenibacillus auburnensis TaxID=2905649 RepID=A0ABM9CGU7_9BACL|nr:hypothetical protein [Paenibacillus auburnensis]CAH1211856.1 hypothetical protein PAECIP111892_03647 [Paenibacillus auburnensis]